MADKKDQVVFTRHSIADYKSYAEALKSEDPTRSHEWTKQIVPDVPSGGKRDGVKLAREQAALLMDEFNPQTDALFVVSSNEARALETAYYYVEVARSRGFEIIEHPRRWLREAGIQVPIPAPEHVQKVQQHVGITDNLVRPLTTLSLNIPNNLTGSVFNSKKVMDINPVNTAALSPIMYDKWKQARAIIEADDKGSWGTNFFYHSATISKIFPDIADTQKVFETQFQRIAKLVEWGMKKIRAANYTKNIKVLGFGHENYWGTALQIYLQNHNIANCESVSISVEEGVVELKRQQDWKTLV